MLKDNLYAELMDELHPNRPRVEILGDSRVIVENHCGIQEYDDSILRVRVPRVRGAHSGCGSGADGAFHGRTGGDRRDLVGGVHHDRVRKEGRE